MHQPGSAACSPSSAWSSRSEPSKNCRAVLSEVLEDASNELGTLARLALQRAQAQWHELDEHHQLMRRAHCGAQRKANEAVKAAATLLGIGSVTASAVVATVGDFKQFKNGAQFRRLNRA